MRLPTELARSANVNNALIFTATVKERNDMCMAVLKHRPGLKQCKFSFGPFHYVVTLKDKSKVWDTF